MDNQETDIPPPRREDQKFCFSCGTLIDASALDCPRCGTKQPEAPIATEPSMPAAAMALVANEATTPLRVNEAYCRGCGKPINAGAPLCPHCGAPQMLPSQSAYHGPPKSRVTAALFAFFLGGLGAHKFYLGDIGMGVLYLLFSWTLIPAIVALIEGIIYLAMSDDDFARHYQRFWP